MGDRDSQFFVKTSPLACLVIEDPGASVAGSNLGDRGCVEDDL